MDVATVITLALSAASLLAGVVGSFLSLRSTVTKGLEKLDTKIDGVESKLEVRLDRLEHELAGFRLETRESLARHDERLAALERRRPGLIAP